MDFTSSRISLESFDQTYNRNIRPKLEAIDVFLKSNTTPYELNEVAEILEVSPLEITNQMKELNFSELDRLSFFSLLFTLSSDLCKLIKRQFKFNHVKHYTAEIISEIYELNVHKVQTAFEDLQITTIQEQDFDKVFQRIHTSVISI